MAAALKDTSVAEIERRLEELREHEENPQRTSVLTHVAWVPKEWSRAAARVLEGLGPRVPSRTIVLHPDPRAKETRMDADVDHECFPGPGREVCAERVELWLRGGAAKAPASVVVPLQVPDLPAFLRWRGKPPFGKPEYEQLIGVADRLIVDSAEWGSGLPAAYRRLAESFERIAVSDLVWTRTLGVRAAIADRWPEIGSVRVAGPRAAALLLRGWLRSRLRRDVRVGHVERRGLRVEIDGKAVRVHRRLVRSESDLLSEELEVYTRDPVYEAAVRAV